MAAGLSPTKQQAEKRTAVPLLNIRAENEPLLAELVEAVGSVLASGRYVLGPSCESLEAEIATRCDARFGIGCASGSDALLLSLMAHGLGPGDEVIVPSFTFFATASAVWRLGATPVFADIQRDTFNLDPGHVSSLINHRTKGIIPVHLFGQCADMRAFCTVANEHELFVIEDAAQALGAKDHEQPAGTAGDVACFSFYPTKNLGGVGDAGMLTTNDEALASRLRLLRGHGMQPRYYHKEVGINSRLDEIQAAMLLVKLKHLDRWTTQRQENARRYTELFRAAGVDDFVGVPVATEGRQHVWNQFTIRVMHGRRDALRAYLADQQIGTEIYYPVPLHQQECFAECDAPPLPETERAAAEVLSLPISPDLTADQQALVVEHIVQFCGDC